MNYFTHVSEKVKEVMVSDVLEKLPKISADTDIVTWLRLADSLAGEQILRRGLHNATIEARRAVLDEIFPREIVRLEKAEGGYYTASIGQLELAKIDPNKLETDRDIRQRILRSYLTVDMKDLGSVISGAEFPYEAVQALDKETLVSSLVKSSGSGIRDACKNAAFKRDVAELEAFIFPIKGFTLQAVWMALPTSYSYEDDYTRDTGLGRCSLVSDEESGYVFVRGPADIIRDRVIPKIAGMAVVVASPEPDRSEEEPEEESEDEK